MEPNNLRDLNPSRGELILLIYQQYDQLNEREHITIANFVDFQELSGDPNYFLSRNRVDIYRPKILGNLILPQTEIVADNTVVGHTIADRIYVGESQIEEAFSNDPTLMDFFKCGIKNQS